jgi:carboxypeptidase C (cathepsin A)
MKLVIYLCLASLVSAAIPDHAIPDLPGWGPPPSNMYAGYVPCSDGNKSMENKIHMHYWFVESENDPATDPVVIWSNGGPGASSVFGLLTELGPLMLSDLSMSTADFNKTGVPSFIRNEHSWTKNASVLIYNSPPPVGYSYCDPAGPAGDGYSCGDWDDHRTAVTVHSFVENWLDAYPEFQKQEMYVIGESYAGIYVPTLVREILNGNTFMHNTDENGLTLPSP